MNGESKSPGTWKDILAGAKDAVALVRELVVVVLLLLFLQFPKEVTDYFADAGFTKGELAGFRWEKAQTASEQAGDASQQIESAAQRIESVGMGLDQLARESEDPKVKNRARSLKSELTQSLQTTRSARQDLAASLELQESVLQSTMPSEEVSEGGAWGVVIAADKNVEKSRHEADRARNLGYKAVAIYDRQNWFRPVVEFSSLAEAREALPELRSKIRDNSYLVDTGKWCRTRGPGREEGTVRCTSS